VEPQQEQDNFQAEIIISLVVEVEVLTLIQHEQSLQVVLVVEEMVVSQILLLEDKMELLTQVVAEEEMDKHLTLAMVVAV
jgi:hypothetical protein